MQEAKLHPLVTKVLRAFEKDQPAQQQSGPRIAFCTTCRGRVEHLSQTLPENIRDVRGYDNAVFVVLDYGDSTGLSQYIASNHKADLDSGRLVYYRNPEPTRFHMAHAKNMAMRCGMLEGADILVTLDADNLNGPGFGSYLAHQFVKNKELSFLAPDFDALPPNGQRFNKHNPVRLGRGFAGRLAIRTNDFVKVGGYNEVFDTWRGEDMDILARLKRMRLKWAAIDPVYLNAYNHSAQVRFKEYPHARQYENDEILAIIEKAHDTVVNYGNIGCGTVYRNYFNTPPIVIGRLPTRIFGIGFQRTGTSSLHSAFEFLGYDSAHWKSADWAKSIWQDMNKWGRSVVLEQSNALCDNPIPVLYKKLDVAYPGSKFILTLRDDYEWLTSTGKFWTYEGNTERFTWDTDGFSHKMHGIAYGSAMFEPRMFLERYRQHNAEVIEYFKDRPDDLLVMRLDKGDGWNKLCPFLDQPMVTGEFPHKNKGG